MKTIHGIFARLTHGPLLALFFLIPFAGAFHPRMRKRDTPHEKEIGAEK